jgi:hypothetical protein
MVGISKDKNSDSFAQNRQSETNKSSVGNTGLFYDSVAKIKYITVYLKLVADCVEGRWFGCTDKDKYFNFARQIEILI